MDIVLIGARILEPDEPHGLFMTLDAIIMERLCAVEDLGRVPAVDDYACRRLFDLMEHAATVYAKSGQPAPERSLVVPATQFQAAVAAAFQFFRSCDFGPSGDIGWYGPTEFRAGQMPFWWGLSG
jgi:hypothetical protein